MDEESPVDPRYHPLQPAPEEIEAWAGREHKRRQAWLAGPTEGEKLDWARRRRRRAVFGLEESRLGPIAEEIEAWAGRERKRREAWVAGPTEEEKRDWARRHGRASAVGLSEPAPPPAPEEIEAWAERERRRRREWLEGPSDDEKQEWARHEAGGFWTELTSLPSTEPALPEAAQRLLREAELVAKGSFYALSRAPAALWSYFIRAGRTCEEEFSREPRRTRVPY